MNKKIIAIAIAAAMAAPVAMADVKVSGQIGGALATIKTEKNTTFSDTTRTVDEAGYSKLQFDATAGMGFARYAVSLGGGLQTSAAPTSRDVYFGVKGGWGALQVGRMNGALKNTEKDPYISTGLQLRKTNAIGGDGAETSGFVNGLVQYSNKFDAVKVVFQFNPVSKGDTTNLTDSGTSYSKTSHEGMTALNVSGKFGPVNAYAATQSYNNWSTNATTQVKTKYTDTKIGASMKFGAIKASLQMSSNKTPVGTINHMLVMADMGLGNGMSVNAAYGTQAKLDRNAAGDTGAAKGTMMRVAINKNLSKGTRVFAGYVVNDTKDATNSAGTAIAGTAVKTTKLAVGLGIKF